MMERLVLTESSPVEESEVEYCKRLQKALTDENKTGNTILPKDWYPKWGNRANGKLIVFSPFEGRYYTKCFAGFLNFEGRQVLIHPRFDKTGALYRYMMTQLKLMPRMTWSHATDVETGMFQAPLVYLFLRQLKAAYDIGVYRQYQTFSYNDSRPKGYINIPLHIRKNPLNSGRVAYSTREYTANNPINRLILAAWQYIWDDTDLRKIAVSIKSKHPELYAPIKDLNEQLGSPFFDSRNAMQVMQAASRPITHHMHQRYEVVRKTSLMLLKRIGPEQAAQKSQHRVSGMLFPMEIMWEFFLEDAVFDPIKGIKVSSQERLDCLLTEAGTPLRYIKADFVLRQKGSDKVTAVLDAKYKEIWGTAYDYILNGTAEADTQKNPTDDEEDGDNIGDEDTDDMGNADITNKTNKPWTDSRIRADSFQVMSYMHLLQTGIGGILFPVVTPKQLLPVKKVCLHAGTEDAILLIPVCLPEDTGDFAAYCEEMDARLALLRENLSQYLFPANN